MTVYSLTQIATLLGGEVWGDGSVVVGDITDLISAQKDSLALCLRPGDALQATNSQAAAFLVQKKIETLSKPQVIVKQGRVAMAKLLKLFHPPRLVAGVHPTAVIDPTAKVHNSCSIGPRVVIGAHCELAENCALYPGVVLYQGVKLGRQVVVHANAVIGADGFGYAWDGNEHLKIEHLAGVEIGDGVEIGANSSIDRGTFVPTRIGAGTKIDNHVHVAHNCQVGKNVIIVSQSNLAGGVTLGDRVIIAGRSGVTEHVSIGADSTVMAMSGVVKDFPAKSVLSGFPARPHRENLKLLAQSRKTPLA